MTPIRSSDSSGSTRWSLTAALMVLLVILAGCGSDEPSAEDQYCEAGDDLESSVDSLINLDLIGEGTNGLTDAVEAVTDAAGELKDSAPEATETEVDDLETSIDDLGTALSDLGGDISSENASAVGDAVSAVGASAEALFAKLTGCP